VNINVTISLSPDLLNLLRSLSGQIGQIMTTLADVQAKLDLIAPQITALTNDATITGAALDGISADLDNLKMQIATLSGQVNQSAIDALFATADSIATGLSSATASNDSVAAKAQAIDAAQ
jgi:ABC-type transporter Mla subunit MlaD